MKRTGTLLFALFLGVCFASHCEATVYHSDGSAASVQFLHDNSAQDGDTITLPAGIFTWVAGVNLSKAITVQGQGVGSTIIRDNVQSGRLIQWDIRGVSNGRARLTDIAFQNGGRATTSDAPGGVFRVTGSNTNGTMFRWDHCTWTDLNGYPVFDTILGVIDHNTFHVSRSPAPHLFYFYGTNWNGGNYGDGSWAAPTNYGSGDFIFVEDNVFNNEDNLFILPATDAFNGARFVVRHNTINQFYITNHGTDSSGRIRSCRAFEVYNNTFEGRNVNNLVGSSRGGGVLFHDNSISNYCCGGGYFPLGDYRMFLAFFAFGGADGLNPWDVNEGPFFTGIAASNSSGLAVTVNGANWTPNQWAGYTIRKPSSNRFSVIMSNTANTLTYHGANGFTSDLAFTVGDSLEIRKVDQAMDGVGRALGSLVSGDNPPPPLGWNDQVTEPCYSWNNSGVNFSSEMPSIRANEHYFNNTPMPGYTPYVYPHPLVSGNPQPSPTPTPTATATPIATVPPTPTPTATATPIATVPPTPTPIPSPNQCEVPNFIGTRLNQAQSIWNDAGFTTEVIISDPFGWLITWQSLPEGFIGSCSDTTITVEAIHPGTPTDAPTQ